MNKEKEKAERLLNIARLYYEEEKTQNEIAKQYGISRPMVSKLLKEAKAYGIVKIQIHDPGEETKGLEHLQNGIKKQYGLKGAVLVKNEASDSVTNAVIARKAIRYMESLKGNSLGIGWGHIIGDLVTAVECSASPVQIGTRICPLIGNGGAGLKNYHSNELVRVIAEHSNAKPGFLYSPANLLSEQEMKLTKELDNYRSIYEIWKGLDVALINIGNFPSVPDFASEARYGSCLIKQKAVGRILNYFVDEEGRIIHSDTDYAIQIPLALLSQIKHVVGICSANTKAKALKGALKTGYIKHIIAPEQAVQLCGGI